MVQNLNNHNWKEFSTCLRRNRSVKIAEKNGLKFHISFLNARKQGLAVKPMANKVLQRCCSAFAQTPINCSKT